MRMNFVGDGLHGDGKCSQRKIQTKLWIETFKKKGDVLIIPVERTSGFSRTLTGHFVQSPCVQ